MRKGILAFPIVFFLLCCAAVECLSAAENGVTEGPLHIEADSLQFDREKNTYEAQGNVIITFSGGVLYADSVVYHKTVKDVVAEGNVFVRIGKDVLEGHKVRFNVASKVGIIYDGILFFERNHLYLQGREIEKKGHATYSIKDAVATTCDGDRPPWRFTSRELEVTVDGYGTLKNATFQVKNIPIMYMPYFLFPAKTTRQTGFLLPRMAYSRDKLGWDINIPFYWAVSENTDATFYQRYMDKRGLQEGLEFRYVFSESSFGTFYADYLRDAMEIAGSEDGMKRDQRGGTDRWSYYFNHETTFASGFYLRTDLKKVSDIWYFKDFTGSNYYLDHYGQNENKRFEKVSFYGDKSLASLESTVRLVKDWDMYNMTALMQYTDNLQSHNNDTTLQKYPEVTFTGIRQPVMETPLNFELESSYDYFYRTSGYRGHALDAYPVFSLPLRWGYYARLTPEIGMRETMWDASFHDGNGEGKSGNREIYTFGASLSTEVHRIFSIGGEAFEKIRHDIKPEIQYRYIPNIAQDDLPDYVAAIPEENGFVCMLTNTLTARMREKDGKVTYLEMLRLKLSQAFNIRELRRNLTEPGDKRRPFGYIEMELTVDPCRYISFDSDARFDVNDGEWKRINYSCNLRDRRGDSVAAEYRYTQNSVEEVNLALKASISRSLGLRYVMRRNELDKKNLETTYGLVYHSQCWSVKAGYSETDDDKSYIVVFSLFGLGQLGTMNDASGIDW